MIKVKENDNIFTARKELQEGLEEEKYYLEQDNILSNRIDTAQKNIVNLEKECQKLKEERPTLLADCKDVTALNKRLKEIENEIEINQDTKTGIEVKRKNINKDIKSCIMSANNRYVNLINIYIEELKKDYSKMAIKFSELLTEIFTLEYLSKNNDYCWFGFIHPSNIERIPNLDDEKQPYWKNNYFGIAKEYSDLIREKYNLPKRNL
jgi:HD-GYP domain-containing protein (c-di-GMP phosphodiesterase class II)